MTLPGPSVRGEADEEARISAERNRLQADAVGGSFWITMQTIMGLPLAVVTNAVIAHALGARAYGTLAIFTAVYGLVVVVLNAGITDASVQWMATHNARNEVEQRDDIIRRCSGYHMFVEAPLVAVLAAVMLHNAGPTAMILGAAASGVVMVLGTSTVVMSGIGLNTLAARISLVVTLATQSTLIAVASASPLPTSVFVGRLVLGLLGPIFAIVLIPAALRSAILRPKLPRQWPPGFLGFGIRTCGSALVSTLVFGRSELFVFQAYGLPEQAGLFALSAGVAGLITAPIDSLLGPLLPATTGLLAIDPGRAGSALLRGLRTSTMLAGMVAAVGIPLVAPLVPLIYGMSFTSATGPFVVLAFVSCLVSVNHPVQAFLLAGRRTGLLLSVGILSVVLDLVVAAGTIPFWGVAGAVVASSVAQISVLGVIAYQVAKMLHVSFAAELRAAAFCIDASLAAGLALGAEVAMAGLDLWARSLVGTVVALTAVCVLGRVRRSVGLTPGDLRVIESGLPRALRALFRFAARVLAVEGHDLDDESATTESVTNGVTSPRE